MKARTFRHGIHPADGKSLSASSPIRLFVPTGAGEAVYPLSQHIGMPAVPVVSVGDRVRAGQKLAEAGGAADCGRRRDGSLYRIGDGCRNRVDRPSV